MFFVCFFNFKKEILIYCKKVNLLKFILKDEILLNKLCGSGYIVYLLY